MGPGFCGSVPAGGDGAGRLGRAALLVSADGVREHGGAVGQRGRSSRPSRAGGAAGQPPCGLRRFLCWPRPELGGPGALSALAGAQPGSRRQSPPGCGDKGRRDPHRGCGAAPPRPQLSFGRWGGKRVSEPLFSRNGLGGAGKHLPALFPARHLAAAERGRYRWQRPGPPGRGAGRAERLCRPRRCRSGAASVGGDSPLPVPGLLSSSQEKPLDGDACFPWICWLTAEFP